MSGIVWCGVAGIAASTILLNCVAKYTALFPHGTWFRQLQSILVTRVFASKKRQDKAAAVAEAQRVAEGRPHHVTVFYAPDDAHCHILLHALVGFCARYVGVTLEVHLVDGGHGHSTGAVAQRHWQRKDAAMLAKLYQFDLPGDDMTAPSPADVAEAQRAVVAVLREYSGEGTVVIVVEAQLGLLRRLLAISTDFFDGYTNFSATPGACSVSAEDAAAVAAAGSLRLKKAGHYLSGTMLYEGELYWGIDRLKHLEERLLALGVGIDGGCEPSFAKTYQLSFLQGAPVRRAGPGPCPPLELFYSPRSPYSQLAVERAIAMADAYGVELVIRPVLPMLMRKLKVASEKAMYIVKDMARESAVWGFPFAKDGFKDPLWEPTFRFMAVWPEAIRAGRTHEFTVSFAHGVYCEGYDFGIDRSFKVLVMRAGLDYATCIRLVKEDAARATKLPNGDDSRLLNPMAAENVKVMNDAGLWGVPCLKFGECFAWGADRLWAMEAAINDFVESQRR